MGVGDPLAPTPAQQAAESNTLDELLQQQAAERLRAAFEEQARIQKERSEIPKRPGGKRNISVAEERERQLRLDTEAAAVDARLQMLLNAANQYLQTRSPDHLVGLLEAEGHANAAYLGILREQPPAQQVETAKQKAIAEGEVKLRFAKDEAEEAAITTRGIMEQIYVDSGGDPAEAKEVVAGRLDTLEDLKIRKAKADIARLNAEATAKKFTPGSPEDLAYKAQLSELNVLEADMKRRNETRAYYRGEHQNSPRSAQPLHAMMVMNLGMSNETLQNAWRRQQTELESRWGKKAALQIRNAAGHELPSAHEKMLTLQQTIGGKLDVPPEEFVAVTSGATLRAFGITTPGEFTKQVAIGLLTQRLLPAQLEETLNFFLGSDIARDQLPAGVYSPETYRAEVQAQVNAIVESVKAIHGDPKRKAGEAFAGIEPGPGDKGGVTTLQARTSQLLAVASSEEMRKLQLTNPSLHDWVVARMKDLDRIVRNRGYQVP